MKYLSKILLTCFLAIVLCMGFAGCDFNTEKKGESAYDIAVRNGFDGTETEWLASLKGTNGINGIDGANGTSLTFDDIYNNAVSNGFNGTKDDFLREYLSITLPSDTYTATHKAILSSVVVTTEISLGSGVIYKLDKQNGDAYIITNYHVVYNENTESKISNYINTYLYGSVYSEYVMPATYVGGSMNYDIAVLKVTNSEFLKTSNAIAVEVYTEPSIAVGQTAIAIGNAKAEGISVTEGIVSVDSEYLNRTGADNVTPVTLRVIRIDTPVNSGNSGGGLFNIDGKMIGIVNAKIIKAEIENMGYAIPVQIAVGVAQNIIDNNLADSNCHQVKRVILGMSLGINSSRAVYNDEKKCVEIIEEVKIDVINDDSIVAGKLNVGEVIESVEYNGVTIKADRLYYLIDFSLNYRASGTVTFNVKRPNLMQEMDTVAVEFDLSEGIVTAVA